MAYWSKWKIYAKLMANNLSCNGYHYSISVSRKPNYQKWNRKINVKNNSHNSNYISTFHNIIIQFFFFSQVSRIMMRIFVNFKLKKNLFLFQVRRLKGHWSLSFIDLLHLKQNLYF